MNKGLVSIIVPVYNVEKYLDKCVQSLVRQTYSNLEIILIDDGATDNSGTVCDKWASKDERVKVIHTENRGLSAARNTGIDNSVGHFLCFVDSDDWIEPNMLEEMYNKAEEFQTDITMCDLKKVGVESEYTVSQPIREGYYNRSMIESELFPCLIMFENNSDSIMLLL